MSKMAALSAEQGQAALAGSSAPSSLQSTGRKKCRPQGMGGGVGTTSAPEHTVSTNPSGLQPPASGVGLGELCSSPLTILPSAGEPIQSIAIDTHFPLDSLNPTPCPALAPKPRHQLPT